MIEGFWPRFCLEDLRWYNDEMDFFASPIVCFCDIPLSRIDEHVGFYGDFGIGVSKKWAVKNGLNPVLYVNSSRNVSEAVINLSWAQQHYPDDEQDKAKLDFHSLLAFTKPVEGKMVIGADVVEKEFYQENEWRYLAKHDDFEPWITHENYESMKEDRNALTKELCSLKITPQDIKYIFVKSDANIPEIVNFIQTDLDHYSGADQKILMSRVVSLESIQSDL